MKKDADNKRLFSFLATRVREIAAKYNLGNSTQAKSKAFIYWFLDTHHQDASPPFISDGSFDGKIDAYSTIQTGHHTKYLVINSKFASTPGAKMTPSHYKEIEKYSYAFRRKKKRQEYLLENKVKDELRSEYHKLYQAYDENCAELIFITTYRRDKARSPSRNYKGVYIFDIDDLYQTLSDDVDGAAPAANPLLLKDIPNILRLSRSDTVAKISVVFARVADFVPYLRRDPYGLLFARNVRIAISKNRSSINAEIVNTYQNESKEFAISNNGITVVCDSLVRGDNWLKLNNPRVVNGGQTLSSINTDEVKRHPKHARVMVRIVEVGNSSGRTNWTRKKELANKIARRANEQNPIKKWDLVANDDYHLELFRLFRARGIYYDRRAGEFQKHSRRLKSFGMRRGPDIKLLSQLIASYKYTNDVLGPAIAKGGVSGLFKTAEHLDLANPSRKSKNKTPYEEIAGTDTEVVYQLSLLHLICKYAYGEHARASRLGQMAQHGNLFCFAAACSAIKAAGYRFGTNKLRRALEVFKDDAAWTDAEELWLTAIDETLKVAHQEFMNTKRRKKIPTLSANNFFKSDAYIRPIFEKRRVVSQSLTNLYANAMSS